MGTTTTNVYSSRRSRADRPPSVSQNSSRNISPRPPSSSSKRHHLLKMAPHAGYESAPDTPSSSSRRHAHPATASRPSQRKGSVGSIGGDRPPTPISKTSAQGSQHSSQQGPQSSLLQEKLQRERKSEIQRNLTRLADEVDAANDPKTPVVTPNRSATADGRRHDSSQQNGDSKKKALGLKEAEKAMTTLHKQNFDLKLELFHRRERQMRLEQKVEELEAERERSEQTNDQLVQEMEKRDKALEEAVQMIIALEARIELLLREREMVKQVEADKTLMSQLSQPMAAALDNQSMISTSNGDDMPPLDTHSLARMPSFVSVRTEFTENLRSVYLGTQASFLSLSKTDSRMNNNGFVSPSMSVLSESSFLSLYGQKTDDISSSPPDIPRHAQSRLGPNGQRSVSLPVADFTPSRSRWIETTRNTGDDKEAMNAGPMSSPPQRLEKLADSPSIKQAVPQPASSGKDVDRPTIVRPIKPQPQLRSSTSRDRPRPARKSVSDEAVGSQQALPPTPDTMSSSMINHGRNQNDSSRRDRTSEEQKPPMLPPLPFEQTDKAEPDHWRFQGVDVAQPPSVSAFTGGKDILGTSYYENRFSAPRRPRSVDENTISRHRIDWDSCSDDDDVCSEASSFDYWMREGLRPSRGGASHTENSQTNASRDPPRLFGFVTDGKGWQSDETFDAPRGGNSAQGQNPPFSPDLDVLGASLPSPETGLFGSGLAGSNSPRAPGTAVAAPPAPYRRSSLQARTSAPGTPRTTRAPALQTKHQKDNKRSVSGHVLSSPTTSGWPTPHNTHSQTPTQHGRPQNQQHQDKSTEKRHYPPQVSHPQAAPRSRSKGLTNLFRRSLGSSTTYSQPSASVPASQSPFPPPEEKQSYVPTVGVPAWERRNDLMDPSTSATPPPIVRNRAPAKVMDSREGRDSHGNSVNNTSRAGRSSTVAAGTPELGAGLSAVLARQEGGAPLMLNGRESPGVDTAAVQSSQGHGRKWFGLGRVASLRSGGTF